MESSAFKDVWHRQNLHPPVRQPVYIQVTCFPDQPREIRGLAVTKRLHDDESSHDRFFPLQNAMQRPQVRDGDIFPALHFQHHAFQIAFARHVEINTAVDSSIRRPLGSYETINFFHSPFLEMILVLSPQIQSAFQVSRNTADFKILVGFQIQTFSKPHRSNALDCMNSYINSYPFTP